MSSRRARGVISLAATALVLSGCGPGADDDIVPPPPPSPSSPPPPPPPPPPSDRVLLQDGFEGFRWSRDVADMSFAELEEWFAASGDFFIRPETDLCSVASHEGLGLTAILDADSAVHALVAEGDFVTPEGIGVGSTLDEVRAAYGDKVIAENESAEVLHVFIDDLERPGEVPDLTSAHYAFEVDQSGTVRVLRAGRVPWILGCAQVTDDGSR